MRFRDRAYIAVVMDEMFKHVTSDDVDAKHKNMRFTGPWLTIVAYSGYRKTPQQEPPTSFLTTWQPTP